MEKDAKSGRQLKRFWYFVTASLGIFMVLFYMYNAGVQPVDTQYHLGIYVLITFVMVFLTYPMTETLAPGPPLDLGHRHGPDRDRRWSATGSWSTRT